MKQKIYKIQLETKYFYNKEMEEAILGGIIIDNKSIYGVLDNINYQDFYFEINKKIFKSMLKISDDGQEINIITIANELSSSEQNIHSILAGITINFINNPIKLSIKLRELSIKRWLTDFFIKTTSELEIKGSTEILAEIGSKISSAYNKTNKEKSSAKEIIQSVIKNQVEVREKINSGRKYIGEECGFSKLDYCLSGIRSFYYLINAYTSVGKTMFSLNIVNNFLNNNKRVVFFSLEMSQDEIMTRLIAIRSGINSISVSMGSFMEDEREQTAKNDLYNKNLVLYSQKRSLDDIKIAMISENLKEKVDLFVIDYLQHIKIPNSTSRYEKYTEASNQIQEMVSKLDVPIIVLSQIDNASASSKQTEVIATKGSGDVPADADVVILMQRDKKTTQCYKDGFIGINFFVQKNRHGVTGNLEFILETKCGRFYDREEYPRISSKN